MDGYAFDGALLAAGAALTLQMADTALAAQAWQGTLQAGECIKIMTGAILPAGLDTVGRKSLPRPALMAAWPFPQAAAASRQPPSEGRRPAKRPADATKSGAKPCRKMPRSRRRACAEEHGCRLHAAMR